MAIVHVTNSMMADGTGITNMAFDLAVAQAEFRQDIVVVSGGGDLADMLRSHKIEHRTVRPSKAMFPVYLWRLAKAIRSVRHRSNVYHCHNMLGVAALSTLRRLHIIRGAIIATVHNEFQRSSIVMGLADIVVGVSSQVSINLAERGVAKAKLRTVVNQTSGNHRQTTGAEVQLQGRPILYVGGFSKRKGLDVLLDAFERVANQHRDVTLYVLGNQDNPDIETQRRKSDHQDRIHFEGFHANPRPWFRAAEILVVPSRRDPAPLVIREARDAGIAIVGSDVDGIPELLEYGAAGRLVPPGDHRLLAAQLIQLFGDQHELKLLTEASAGQVGTVRSMASEYLELYALS